MRFRTDLPLPARQRGRYFFTQTFRPIGRLLVSLVTLALTSSDSPAITLAEAADLPMGTTVTIDEALVTNATRMTVSGHDLIQLRDDTRAISFFAGGDGIPLDDFLAGIHTGDVISFTATTLNYNGQFEMTTPLSPAIKVVAPTISTLTDPVPVTPQDFDDLSPMAEGFESQYVELQGIELFYGSPSIQQGASAGRPVAGELFEPHTTYVARDLNGHESIIWARSQGAVNSLNVHFGGIPAGPFNLPGIFMHFFDPEDPLPGVTGVNYLLNPIFVTLPGDLDADGFVGIGDLNIILTGWNTQVTQGNHPQGDPSNDGFVGIDDLTLVLSHWNAGTPPGEVDRVVPEPGGFMIFLACSGLLYFRQYN